MKTKEIYISHQKNLAEILLGFFDFPNVTYLQTYVRCAMIGIPPNKERGVNIGKHTVR